MPPPPPACASAAGTRVTVVTAKDKLLRMLSHNLPASPAPAAAGPASSSALDSLVSAPIRPLSVEAAGVALKKAEAASSSSAASGGGGAAIAPGAMDVNVARACRELVGRAPPSIYDPDVSIFALELGLRLLQRDLQASASTASTTTTTENNNTKKKSLFYLSTTDYVQHKYAPGTPQANDFMHKVR